MIINGKEFGFEIIPNEIYVVATIFEVYPCKDKDLHFKKLSKEFGFLFRKPTEEDYVKARKWVDMQMKSMLRANSKTE